MSRQLDLDWIKETGGGYGDIKLLVAEVERLRALLAEALEAMESQNRGRSAHHGILLNDTIDRVREALHG